MSQQQRQQSLVEWFLSYSSSASSSSASASLSSPRRILLLDGGVSTHLQEIMIPVLGSSTFSVRQLWSSSLLLHQKDHQIILRGHLDWLQAGTNVITTVTYQCHFQQDLWPTTTSGTTTTTDDELLVDEKTMHQLWKDGIALAKQAVTLYQDNHYNSTIPPTDTTDTDTTHVVAAGKKEQSQAQYAAHPLYVVASSGCFGAALANGAEYTGDYNDHNSDMEQDDNNSSSGSTRMTIQKLKDFHQKKIAAAVKHGPPDGIAIETIPSLLECQALQELFCSDLTTVNDQNTSEHDESRTTAILPPGMACWISLACQNATQLNDGSTVRQALDCLFSIPSSQVQAIGFNCCDSIYLNELAKTLTTEMALRYNCHHDHDNNNNNHQQNERRGIVLYPNSGEEWEASTESWKQGTGVRGEEDNMAERLLQVVQTIETTWKEMRPKDNDWTASIPRILIGGCCRTQPSTIAALQKRVDEHLLLLQKE